VSAAAGESAEERELAPGLVVRGKPAPHRQGHLGLIALEKVSKRI
jgi:hypothetical protein